MASSSETARAYFTALSDHDIDAAVALWRPGGVDHISGYPDRVAPQDLRGFFGDLFSAFPDWHFEILDTTTQRGRCVVRWSATATFAGPGRVEGFVANGGRVQTEGADVLTIEDGQITANHAYLDRVDLMRQLGLLPEPGSGAERGLTALTNVRHVGRHFGGAKVIAPGVWLVAGGLSPTFNVYLLAEAGGGVTVFDAGVKAMTPAVAAAGARLGGIRRVVLGHADCDHRGAAPGLKVPVYTHALEREAAQAPEHRRPYWDLRKLKRRVRPVYPFLFRSWDGGAVEVAGAVAEGDEIAGFRVVELPGHAPGLIGLFREEDGLALCSDALYTVNVETGLPCAPRVPNAAFNLDEEQTRASLVKLAALEPRVVWPGHSRPVSGAGVSERLAKAARA